MSLINQMLQDIENRKTGEQLPLYNALPIHAAPAVRSQPWLPLIALAFIGGGIAYVWQYHQAMEQSASPLISEANAGDKVAQFKSLEMHAQNMDAMPNAALASKVSFKPNFDKSLDFAIAKDSLIPVSLSTKPSVATKPVDSKLANSKPAFAQENQTQVLAMAQASAPLSNGASAVAQILPEVDAQTKSVEAKTTIKPASEGKVVINKHLNAEQLALRDYQQALTYLQQGRVAEAQDLLKKAIATYPEMDDARQTLVGLLVDNNKVSEAIAELKAGIALKPNQVNQIQTLAQLQFQAGLQADALATLQQGLPYANQNEDYLAFMAAVLQQQGQHQAAITHYQQALSSGKNNPAWLIGLGISLQAEGRNQEAKEIYQKIPRDHLSAELVAFLDQRLKQIP